MRLQAACYCAGIGVIAFLQTTACTICFAPEHEYELPSTTTLYRWPLSEPTPTPFFTFKYNLEKGTGQFGGFLDPELQDSAMLGGLREDEFGYRLDEVVRLGTWNQQANDIAFARRKAYMAKSPHGGTKPVERDLTGWVGIAITMSAFRKIPDEAPDGIPFTLVPMLTLHHHPYNYNLTNAAEREEMALIGMSLTQGKVLCSAEPITIILRASTELPPVQFESPIPLTEDGKPILPVKDERSILQKYWWVFLIAALFAVTSGAGGGD